MATLTFSTAQAPCPPFAELVIAPAATGVASPVTCVGDLFSTSVSWRKPLPVAGYSYATAAIVAIPATVIDGGGNGASVAAAQVQRQLRSRNSVARIFVAQAGISAMTTMSAKAATSAGVAKVAKPRHTHIDGALHAWSPPV